MTSRELVIRCLNHESTPRVPRDYWLSPETEARCAEAIDEMRARFPGDLQRADIAPAVGGRSQGVAGVDDEYRDPWGCVWQSSGDGTPPTLKLAPLAGSNKFPDFRPPFESIGGKRYENVNKGCEAANRFVLAWSETSPFDRLRALRGAEKAIMDLARGGKEIRSLLAALHAFNCEELKALAATDVDGVVIGDDWGTDDSLLVSLEMWRDIFNPLYRDYCRILQEKDKFVFFRSRGFIVDIFNDLIKDGVDAIHGQFSAIDGEKLAKKFRGKVTVWGEADPELIRRGNPAEIKETALSIRRSWDFGAGGFIAQCQLTPDMTPQALAAYFEQWLVPLAMHA